MTLYNDYGKEGLNYSPPPGQHSWLTLEQKEQLNTAVQKKTEESGKIGNCWIFHQVIEFCERSFFLHIKKRTALKCLRDLGFIRKRPNNNLSKQISRNKRFLTEMDQLEKQGAKNGLTFYIDQAKYCDMPDLTTMWVLHGQEAVYRSIVPDAKKGFVRRLLSIDNVLIR